LRRVFRPGGVAALLATTLLGLLVAAPASAGESRAELRDNFQVYATQYVPWPFERVTYATDFGGAGASRDFAVRRAVSSFNRMNAGYRLVRVADPNEANVVFTTSGDDGGCRGTAHSGWDFYPAFVFLNGRCDRYAFTLVAAHEIGHVFLLTDTTETIDAARDEEDPDTRAALRERVGCSIMNNPRPRQRRFKTVAGRPDLVAPLRCRAGSRQYWRSPFQPGDVEGVKYGRSLVFGYPYEICRPENEPDSTQSAWLRSFTLCQFEYDCRGVEGEAPGNLNDALAQDANGRYPWLRNCREQPYDTAGGDREAAKRQPVAAARQQGDAPPRPFAFP
jgi:hypothetical protein